MQLNHRKDVPLEETWNLQDLYKDETDFKKDQTALEKMVDHLVDKDLSSIQQAEDMIALIREYEQLIIKYSKLNTFAQLSISTDMTDPRHQEMNSQFRVFASGQMTKLAVIDNFINSMDEKMLAACMELAPEYTAFLNQVLRNLPHKLSDQTETALTALQPVMDLPYLLYEQAKLADMQFDPFKAGGKKHPLSFVLFENHYQYAPERKLRRGAFKAFSQELKKYQHTIATAYATEVQKDKILATLRGYDSVFDYLLHDQQIPRDIYDQHLDTIFEHLAPVMRKWAKLLAKVHGIKRMHFADLKLPLDPDFVPKVTIEEAKDYARSALNVMGGEYSAIVEQALDKRWIDWAQNIGKSTGGFCSSPYAAHSYVLLSWTGLLSEVFTLVHELGHVGHFEFANKAQNLLSVEPSLYFIEAPSTINETLLANELITRNRDPRYQRFVLSSLIGNTYYHNYVTHFLEAYFQREVYRLVDAGESITAERLHALKKQTLSDFWAEAVKIDDDAALTWMRQPHYYMGLYPYTYSAGLSIATKMSAMIRNEGQPAVDKWIEALKAGGTKTPVELAKTAGVDITKKDVLIETIQYIDSLIESCTQLTKRMKKEKHE